MIYAEDTKSEKHIYTNAHTTIIRYYLYCKRINLLIVTENSLMHTQHLLSNGYINTITQFLHSYMVGVFVIKWYNLCFFHTLYIYSYLIIQNNEVSVTNIKSRQMITCIFSIKYVLINNKRCTSSVRCVTSITYNKSYQKQFNL